MARKITEWVLRLLVATVFLYAGGVKAWDTQQFALDVQNYQLTSWTASIAIAVYLPWLEILAGLALIVRKLYAGALLALLGMTIIFLGAIVSAWARGLDITCGCFGRAEIPVSYPEMIGRDLALMAAIGVLLLFEFWRLKERGAASEATL